MWKLRDVWIHVYALALWVGSSFAKIKIAGGSIINSLSLYQSSKDGNIGCRGYGQQQEVRHVHQPRRREGDLTHYQSLKCLQLFDM